MCSSGRQKKHNRQFLEARRVFDEWVTNYPIKLRPKLNPRRFRATDPDWWKHATLEKHAAYWGGEVAAAKLTHYLKPANCTMYVKPHTRQNMVNQLAAANRWRADPDGNIEVLDAFWNLPEAFGRWERNSSGTYVTLSGGGTSRHGSGKCSTAAKAWW